MFYSRKTSWSPHVLLVVPIMLIGFIVGSSQSYATELGNDFSSNSLIELNEVASGGDYRNKVIRIITRNGDTTVTVITDGNTVASEMPYEVCETLWGYLMEKDVGYLEDAIGGAFPDSSTFNLKVSAGGNTHTVKVEGIDTLVDSRPRDIAREIIRVSEIYAPKDAQ